MAISMGLPVSASFHTKCCAPLCLVDSSKCGNFFPPLKLCRRRRNIWKPFQISSSTENYILSSESGDGEVPVDFWGDSEFVEVIGIGSRKDAVLDFCLRSPLQSSSLRFWNILKKDTIKVQLQQRFLGEDISPVIVEASLRIQSCSKAIILVASAGYGLDHDAAIDMMKAIRSANGYAIAIILKPFSFEGRRRQDEVRDLVEKLVKDANFFIDVDTDKLLENELVTLDEAMKTANKAVLLAINAISVLISEIPKKLIDLPCNNMKDIKFPEIMKNLDCYKEGKIGFGAGCNITTSIVQAIYDSPFLYTGVKDMNGMVLCFLATPSDIDNISVAGFVHTFRQTTGYTKEIILSIIHEPNLEPNSLLITVVNLGCHGRLASQKSSILSKVAQRFSFVFNLLGRHYQQSDDALTNGLDIYSKKPEMILDSNYDEIFASRNNNSGYDESDFGLLEASTESTTFYDRNIEGYQIAQEWAKEKAADSGPLPMHENLSIFRLPVGVRSSGELKDSPDFLSSVQCVDLNKNDNMKTQSLDTPGASRDTLTDAGVEAVRDLYVSASTMLKGKYADPPKKQRALSTRAASMLEAERDKPKKWSPIVEIQYRGGVYSGRCQGGLPEGKGRLTLEDGSIYDGMWRCGKKSGSGTFYFSNGDVFKGSWRDDLMQGKGWFYFYNGDRWFANFWKGKANGEGRFYSKSGDIFFGHFRDGWRHGRFLCINVHGARCTEVWDEGVLVSCEELDSDSISG